MNMCACRGLFLEGEAAGFLRTTMSFPIGFTTFAQLLSDGTILAAGYPGGVAERLIAPVLKTGRPKGLVSSNLTPSAMSFSIAPEPKRVSGVRKDFEFFCLTN